MVSYWYWGDYNSKPPALWDKRDPFNILYRVPPMFMFNRQLWEAKESRFVQSCQNTCPIVRRIAASEMTDHRFLTSDRNVQQTTFANGLMITINFGGRTYALPNGETIEALRYQLSGPK